MKKKYKIGELVEGVVTGIEDYGIFVSFGEYTGLIHISELSEHFVNDVSLYAKIGDKIPCLIIEIDEKNQRLKCSLKNTKYGEEKDFNINHGFAPLKKQLPIWINEKIKEYKIK
ncbi:MAG: S1 RNA-binding domain-containing protein [Bacilli bacterium]|nr:S1 RNA-binding domain-containing protein [Bacilli bacterium]